MKTKAKVLPSEREHNHDIKLEWYDSKLKITVFNRLTVFMGKGKEHTWLNG